MRRGFAGAPLWGWVLITAAAVFLVVATSFAVQRGNIDPLTPAEQSRMATRAAAAASISTAAAPKPVLFLADAVNAALAAAGITSG